MTVINSLHISNFQSLRDIHVDLQGFTVIVGPSSSGKSALVRAIRTLVSNRRGTDWITTGEKTATITAETPSGTVTLTRSRTSASPENHYTLVPCNGEPQVYNKLGGETPDDVSAFLKIPHGSTSNPPINFAGQFDRPYLLADSAAEVARTLGALTNVSVLFDAARESNRTSLQSNQTLKLRSTDLAAVKSRIPEFQKVKEQSAALSRAEKLVSAATDLERKIARLEAAVDALETLEPIITRLEDQAAAPVPDDSRALRALEALRSFERAVGVLGAAQQAVRAAESNLAPLTTTEESLLLQQKQLHDEATRDIYDFVKPRIDPMDTLPHDTGVYVELSAVVKIFADFLEMRIA